MASLWKYNLRKYQLPTPKISILAVILIYILIVPLVQEIIWPTIYFYLASWLSLHHYFSTLFLVGVLSFGEVLIVYSCCIILLAGCFDANGLLINKRHTIYPPSYKAANSLGYFIAISSIYLFVIFAFLLALGIPQCEESLPSPKDQTNLLYIAFETSSFSIFFDNYMSVGMPTFYGTIARLLSFLFCFLIAYHRLVPQAILIGIQKHLWKIDIFPNSGKET